MSPVRVPRTRRQVFFEAERRHEHESSVSDLRVPRTDPQIDSALARLRSSQGTDTFPVRIPDNHSYAVAVVISLPPSHDSATAVIATQPSRGATGDQEITVRWMAPPFAEVRYRLRAYATSSVSPPGQPAVDTDSGPEYEELHVVNQQSVERLHSLLIGREHIDLVFSGPDVQKLVQTGLFSVGSRFPPSGPAGALMLDPLTITALGAIILGLAAANLAAFVMTALTVVILTALALGYSVETLEFELPNPPNMGKLVLRLTAPS